MQLRISNHRARRLWLTSQGLASSPTGKLDVMAIIRGLGYVQLDSIQVVSRAHHHIIWSRNQNYREQMLNRLMADERKLFEHFTHDASVIPMEFFPMWQRQFRRMREYLDRSQWYGSMSDGAAREAIKQRIRNEGSLSTHAFDTKVNGPKKMWARPPHKKALDYMWYCGELATCHRVNFTKFYNLAERIYPVADSEPGHSEVEQIDWLCAGALHRLGVGSIGEVQKFWDAVSVRETKDWAKDTENVPVQVQAADGNWSDAVAPMDIEARLAGLTAPTSRLRILNPFDPVVRDRNRLKRLFGFDYRVEMFVPKAKRKWGYYVYPMLEGDRFVGRIELKGDRVNGVLKVLNIWAESGILWTVKRQEKVAAELKRLARLASLERVFWDCAELPDGNGTSNN